MERGKELRKKLGRENFFDFGNIETMYIVIKRCVFLGGWGEEREGGYIA